MRYDESKSFPYPVLRTGSDDYTEGAFQATLRRKLSHKGQKIRIDASFRASEPTLQKLLKSGEAEFALLVEARETYFRDLIRTGDAQKSKEYDGGQIKGPVTLLAYVLAKKDISDFHSPHFNDEYGNRKFDIEAGDVLALDVPREFYVGQEVFANIGGIWLLVEDKTYEMGDFGIGLDNEKVQILMSPKQKEMVVQAREQKEHRPILWAGVYFPALMQVLSVMSRGTGDFEDRKWHRSITAKCDDLGIELDEDTEILAVAQRLLGYPIAKVNTQFFSKE